MTKSLTWQNFIKQGFYINQIKQTISKGYMNIPADILKQDINKNNINLLTSKSASKTTTITYQLLFNADHKLALVNTFDTLTALFAFINRNITYLDPDLEDRLFKLNKNLPNIPGPDQQYYDAYEKRNNIQTIVIDIYQLKANLIHNLSTKSALINLHNLALLNPAIMYGFYNKKTQLLTPYIPTELAKVDPKKYHFEPITLKHLNNFY